MSSVHFGHALGRVLLLALAGLALLAVTPNSARAGAVYDVTVFTGHAGSLGRIDDAPSVAVDLGFRVSLFGTTSTQVFVNNNGNISFTSPLTDFLPDALRASTSPVIAPFFADVDTRGSASGVVTYGSTTLGGHTVFGFNWVKVGYWEQQTDHLNSFQLLIIDRNDVATGAFDFVFNYDSVQWDGYRLVDLQGNPVAGGQPARVGWTDGLGHGMELNGSGVVDALLDGGPFSLVARSLNSPINGRYYFAVRNGNVIQSEGITPINFGSSGSTPEPGSVPLAALALLGSWVAVKRRRRKA